MRYIEKLRCVFNCDPANALTMGTAIHKGLETDVDTAINEYFNSYPIVTDEMINETIKIRHWVPIVKSMIPEGQHELKIETEDFIGFIDLLTKNEDGSYDLWDYKYSNNIENYMKSGQLHIYKDYVEEVYKIKIRKLFFVFIPKTSIRQKNDEDLSQFRKRLYKQLEKMEVQIKEVPYDKSKRIEFLETIQEIKKCKNFDEKRDSKPIEGIKGIDNILNQISVERKNTLNENLIEKLKEVSDLLIDEKKNYIDELKLCDWCEYESLCKKGIDYMILPKNERKEASINTTPDMWLYGDSYSGKTVFMDSFDDNLMINTDGNVDHITSPVIRIKDEVTVNGRLTRKKYAWESFKEVIDELEKKDNTFKIITVDLVEDMYEHCRLYMYHKEGWEHESDGAFGKGWDMIMTEFLSTMKRLKNTGYQIVYLSKQVTNTITYKSGQEVTTFKPNIKDKIANVLAGTVDLTARIVVEDDGKHYLSFKNSETIFGGSRYNFGVERIPLNHDAFIKVMVDAQEGKKVKHKVVDEPKKVENEQVKDTEEPKEAQNDTVHDKTVEKTKETTKVDKSVPEDSERPIRRRRKVSE